MSEMNILTYPGVVLDQKIKRVFFTGSTAITKGNGCAYDRDYGTAATAEQRRSVFVEAITTTNHNDFAGVFIESRPAVTGGQFVDIALPGSDCFLNTTETSLTVNSDIINCRVDTTGAGAWVKLADPVAPRMRGSAKVLQTISAAGLVLAHLDDGEEGNSVCVQKIQPNTSGTANQSMVGGITWLYGTVTIGDADDTSTLADGTFVGQLKIFTCSGTFTTNNYQVTVTTGIQGVANNSPTTALSGIEFDADNEHAVLRWMGNTWVLQSTTTAALT